MLEGCQDRNTVGKRSLEVDFMLTFSLVRVWSCFQIVSPYLATFISVERMRYCQISIETSLYSLRGDLIFNFVAFLKKFE